MRNLLDAIVRVLQTAFTCPPWPESFPYLVIAPLPHTHMSDQTTFILPPRKTSLYLTCAPSDKIFSKQLILSLTTFGLIHCSSFLPALFTCISWHSHFSCPTCV